ncbi:MAG: hypothetical protein ACKOE8_03935, partial [Opitutaceae bacterium]
MSRLAALGESDGRRMKFLNPPALALAALFSVIFSLPFLPAARMRTDRFVLEVRLKCPKESSLQVFYDDGPGFREELTTATPLKASSAVETYTLNLPGGTYLAL